MIAGRRRPMPGGGSQAGQAMVEFALVAPMFFVLLFGVIEGARFIYHYQTVQGATREGARYAIVHGSNATPCPSGPMPGGVTNPCDPDGENVKDAVRDAAFGTIDPDGFTTLTVVWDPSNLRGSLVTVGATYSYEPALPLMPSIPIEVESTLVINN